MSREIACYTYNCSRRISSRRRRGGLLVVGGCQRMTVRATGRRQDLYSLGGFPSVAAAVRLFLLSPVRCTPSCTYSLFPLFILSSGRVSPTGLNLMKKVCVSRVFFSFGKLLKFSSFTAAAAAALGYIINENPMCLPRRRKKSATRELSCRAAVNFSQDCAASDFLVHCRPAGVA